MIIGTDRIKVTMPIDNIGICPCMYQTVIATKVKLDPINMSREKIFIFIDFVKLFNWNIEFWCTKCISNHT